MSYWVRENRSPPYKGPFTGGEIVAAMKRGEFSLECEVLEASGQTQSALSNSTEWRPVSEQVKKLVEAHRATQPEAAESSSKEREFPALKMLVGIHYVVAALAFIFGLLGVIAGLAASQGLLAIAALALAIFVPLFLWAIAEMIELFLQIEKNTRPRRADAGATRGGD
jgi:hypothetical protein